MMFHAVNEMVAAVNPRQSDTGISVSATATFTAAIVPVAPSIDAKITAKHAAETPVELRNAGWGTSQRRSPRTEGHTHSDTHTAAAHVRGNTSTSTSTRSFKQILRASAAPRLVSFHSPHATSTLVL